MTLPNKITLFRLLLTVAAAVMFYSRLENNYSWSLFFFLLAMLLDYLDGWLARKLNQVTDLGGFLDPLVDKITIITFLICLTDTGIIPAWLALLLIFRDIAIASFRNLAVTKGVFIPARWSGKIKTFFQTLGIAAGLVSLAGIFNYGNFFSAVNWQSLAVNVLIIATLISYSSGWLIIFRNYKKVF